MTVPFKDGDYERLANGRAGYNQGHSNSRWGEYSLPEMLKQLSKSSNCEGYLTEAEPENICFEYGESLWNSGHSWDFVRGKALLDQPLAEGGDSVKIDCPTT